MLVKRVIASTSLVNTNINELLFVALASIIITSSSLLNETFRWLKRAALI